MPYIFNCNFCQTTDISDNINENLIHYKNRLTINTICNPCIKALNLTEETCDAKNRASNKQLEGCTRKG